MNRFYPSQNAEMYFQSRVQMMRVCEAKKTAREHLESRLSFAKLTGVHSKWSSDDGSLRSCGCDATVFGIACVVRKRVNKYSKSKIDTHFVHETVISPKSVIILASKNLSQNVVTACVSCSILPPGEGTCRNQTKTLFYFF